MQMRLGEAEAIQLEVLEIQRRVLGPEHPDMLTMLTNMHNLAWNWKLMNRSKEAIALMAECVRLSERSLGSQHPGTILCSKPLMLWQTEKLNPDEDVEE